MRFLSPLLGVLTIVVGAFALRGPTDIQIGIGCTAILGGIILCVLGAVLGGQARLRRELQEVRSGLSDRNDIAVRTQVARP